MNFSQLIFDNNKHIPKLWTLQLYKEYEQINYQYGAKLKRPTIIIKDLKRNAGENIILVPIYTYWNAG